MAHNNIIPISNGLFEHKERIGPAIWEFLWCIDAVTSETVDDSGERWGLVHGGAPVKHETIAAEIRTSSRTVQRNLALLKKEGYITSLRVARGEIIKVRNNKKPIKDKRYAKCGASLESDTSKVAYHVQTAMPKMADHKDDDTTKLSYHDLNDMPNMEHHAPNDTPKMEHQFEGYAKNGASDSNDMPNVASLKDFKDFIAITPTNLAPKDDEGEDPYIQILNAYCKLHQRFDIHVKPKERHAMNKLITDGIPAPFTIRAMGLLYAEKQKREKEDFKLPSSFLYFVDGIRDAWKNENTKHESNPSTEAKTGKNKQMEFLNKLLEVEKRGQSGGH
ncbi:hypothetical protein [Paenibacillus tyrfis]|uniref:Uncharacterized protein n=1 Tax=Paenibacillus tyrfis TaxID=1501230 RepID=A0A081NWN2_9BACL|nr:hypothetical protein [Paenibacillus tyrfis]KEQ22855.1 hypothetical protein ET33_21125 [Paenibacillus tyrfis]